MKRPDCPRRCSPCRRRPVEIRVRGALALLHGLRTVATRFGLEAILGAFLAGAALGPLDRDEGEATHPLLPAQAPGDRLLRVRPVLLRHHGHVRSTFRALIDRAGHARAGTVVPLAPPGHSRRAGAAPLPAVLGRRQLGRRRAAPGNFVEHSRRRRRPSGSAWVSDPSRTTPPWSPPACCRSSSSPLVALPAARSGAPRRPKGARFRRRAEAASRLRPSLGFGGRTGRGPRSWRGGRRGGRW